MKCSICGGTKASGYVQRLIAEGKLDASKVSNPSKFVINLGKAHQKRIDELASKKGQQMEKPKRKLRTAKEKKEAEMMGMEDRDAPEMKTPKFYANSNKKFNQSSHFGIYRLDSIEPPVLTSMYSKVRVLNGNHYIVTEKKNNQGKILRTLIKNPKRDEYFAFASRGKTKGKIKDTLKRYFPTEIELEFINGNKETITFTEPAEEKEEKEDKKPVVKEVKVLTTAELQKKDEVKEKRLDKKWKDEINKKKKEREELEQQALTNKYAKEALEAAKKTDEFYLERTGNIYGVSRPLV